MPVTRKKPAVETTDTGTAKKRAARKPVGQPTPPLATFTEPIEETPVTEETPTTERKTRQADPLLAAKRRLEKARAAEAKAQKRVDAHGDIIAALEAAKAETEAAASAFAEAVAAV